MLLANSPGSPQTVLPAVLIGHPGTEEVGVRPALAAEVLQVKLSLQFQGECSVPSLLLDLADIVLVQCLLADWPAPLQVQLLL